MAFRIAILFMSCICISFVIDIGGTCPYDYFMVVMQHQENVCMPPKKCLQNPQPIFSIHGLWPSNYSGIRNVEDKLSPFDPLVLTDPKRNIDLQEYWPDVLNGNGPKFWLNEWRAHGTCFPGSPAQYFDYTLHHGVLIQNIFDLGGIEAKNTTIAKITLSGEV